MTKRVVEFEIKLEKSVKVILGVLALGVLLNAFAPAFSITEAFAEWNSHRGWSLLAPLYISCDGCNKLLVKRAVHRKGMGKNIRAYGGRILLGF
jgi:hypothetical protein